MEFLAPFSIQQWLKDNAAKLQPPIGNKAIFKDNDFIVMAVGGPNARKDYHVNQGAELFFQLQGDLCLRTRQNDQIVDIIVSEGDIFELPPRIPHSPQRAANTLGFVVERKRLAHEQDALEWYCDGCQICLYHIEFHLTDVEKNLKTATETFMQDVNHRTCKQCQQILEV